LNDKWGLGKKEKVIYVTADEKWFLGITPQHGKLCERLGLTKSHLYAQHKDHVPKVLAIAFTAYAFEGSMENGGKGLKIGCYRCQSAKIAGKAQNKSVKGKDGKVTYPGPDQGGERLREKGQAYMVDCAITGSDEGTSSDPKFALLPLLRDSVFGDILALTAAGAPLRSRAVTRDPSSTSSERWVGTVEDNRWRKQLESGNRREDREFVGRSGGRVRSGSRRRVHRHR